MPAERANLMRSRGGQQRVTTVELTFDLVFVFAVTQLSHSLLARPTATGAVQTALLLTMVWLLWVYTTWVTNWLDPDRIAVRLLLLALAAISLSACTVVAVIAVAVADQVWQPARPHAAAA